MTIQNQGILYTLGDETGTVHDSNADLHILVALPIIICFKKIVFFLKIITANNETLFKCQQLRQTSYLFDCSTWRDKVEPRYHVWYTCFKSFSRAHIGHSYFNWRKWVTWCMSYKWITRRTGTTFFGKENYSFHITTGAVTVLWHPYLIQYPYQFN